MENSTTYFVIVKGFKCNIRKIEDKHYLITVKYYMVVNMIQQTLLYNILIDILFHYFNISYFFLERTAYE